MGSVEALREVVDQLVADEPEAPADGATAGELARQVERLQAVLTQAAAAFEAEGSWRDDGARTAAAWLAHRCHEPVAVAKRRLWLGRCLRSRPAAAAAWRTGDIGEAQVRLLARARNERTSADLDRDEAMLVGEGRGASVRRLRPRAGVLDAARRRRRR